MEASATAVHICPPSEISTEKFPARPAPDDYVYTFDKSSMQDPLLPASGAPKSKQVSYTLVKSMLNYITYGHILLNDLQNCFTRICFLFRILIFPKISDY